MLRVPVVAVSPRESVTLIANCRLPVAVGVPLMTPVLDPIVSGDNEPLATVNVKPVPEPPTAMKAGEVYPTFTRPGGNGGGVIAIGPLTVMLSWLVEAVFPTESVTLIVNCKVPAIVGIPVMIPVDEPIDSGDNEPVATANVYPLPEPPLAVKAGEV
jgi:hypothetical protein